MGRSPPPRDPENTYCGSHFPNPPDRSMLTLVEAAPEPDEAAVDVLRRRLYRPEATAERLRRYEAARRAVGGGVGARREPRPLVPPVRATP